MTVSQTFAPKGRAVRRFTCNSTELSDIWNQQRFARESFRPFDAPNKYVKAQMAGPDLWIDSVLPAIIHEAAHSGDRVVARSKNKASRNLGPFIVREQGEPIAAAKIALAALFGNLLLRWRAGT